MVGDREARDRPHASRELVTRCSYTIERRGKGLRYVYWRKRCARRTSDPSGYCWQHRA